MNSGEKGERTANNGGIYSGCRHVVKLGRTKKQRTKKTKEGGKKKEHHKIR